MTKISIGLVVSFLSMACSGPAAPDGPPNGGAAACTVTISGAVTANKSCIVAATHDDQGLHFGIETTDGTFALASDLPGSSLQTGTFAAASTTKTVSTVDQGTAVWAEFYQDGQHPNQGDASFTLSDTGTEVTGQSGNAWTGEHGTLSATLAPADQFATGTVTVTASF